MQNAWKKVGAALGSAVMIGATLAGAAFANTTGDLGDYEDLVMSDGIVDTMFVVGANAATADVVSAIGMASSLGNLQAYEEVTTTITEVVDVTGLKRHVELDNTGNNAYEFGGSAASTDKLGPAGYASGDGVVDYLYSYKDKGPIYVNGTDKYWHEEIVVDNTKLNPIRDSLSSDEGDKYDEVMLKVGANALAYQYVFDTPIPAAELKGKKIYFMGKEYTVISVDNSQIKLGSETAEVVLTSTDSGTNVGDVEVSLGGLYSTGANGNYKAKLTVTHSGTTETKYVTSGATDTIAGVEVFVKNAVVTTTGTNEGEAQLIVGANILKIEDGNYLKLGDGTETTWQVAITTGGSGYEKIKVVDTEARISSGSTNSVLYPSDVVTSPMDLFSLSFNGLTDKYGGEPMFVDVDVTPTTRDLDRDGTAQSVIRVRTPSGESISYTDTDGISRTTNELWVNVTEDVVNDYSRFYYRDPTSNSLSYAKVDAAPYVKLTTSNTLGLTYTNVTATDGYFTVTEPALATAGDVYNVTAEYNSTAASGMGQFEDIDGAAGDYYMYYDNYGSTDISRFMADDTSDATPATRDYYTTWGTIVDGAGHTLISLRVPQEQLFAEYMLGVKSVTGGTEETTMISKPVTLPTTISKIDSELSDSDRKNYNLILVGGPAVNTLVNELQVVGKLTNTFKYDGVKGAVIDEPGEFSIELIKDAFVEGKFAMVVAGYDREGTAAAGNMIANFADNKDALDGKTVYVG